jgi:hypothetical protein
MVKLGDYYYHGLGVSEPDVLLKEKAAGYYQSAIETHSAVAMWNIGWMYENGVGVPQVLIVTFVEVVTYGRPRTSIWLNDITTWLSSTTRQHISQSYYRSSNCIFGLCGTLLPVDDNQTSFFGAMMVTTIIGGPASCGGPIQNTTRL